MLNINHQRGVVLVVSLVFLMLMTMIGVTAMQGTTQEEKMARNAAQRGLAFQVAESGLRVAEAFVANTPSAGDSAMLGVFSEPLVVPDTDFAKYWDEYNWEESSVVYENDKLPSNPRYVVEKLDTLPGSGGSDSFSDIQLGVAEPEIETTTNRFLYRITSRGTGSINDAVVILQSTFSTGQ